MFVKNASIDEVIGRHTDEFKERVDINLGIGQMVVGRMTERERKIFEMGFGAGYVLGADEERMGESVEVLK